MHRLAKSLQVLNYHQLSNLNLTFFFFFKKSQMQENSAQWGVSVGLVAYLTLCLPLGPHLLMENPPHPGSLCFMASLCPPSPWLRSPVIAQGFVLCTLADIFIHSLPHHPAQSPDTHSVGCLPRLHLWFIFLLSLLSTGVSCPPTLPLADTANGETLSQLTPLSPSPVHSLSSWYSLKPKLISDLNKVTSFPTPDHPT